MALTSSPTPDPWGSSTTDLFLRLDSAFDRSIGRWRDCPGPVTILYSGGVDSGLLAWELRRRPDTRLFTVGTPGAGDLAAAESTASRIGLPWTGKSLSDDDLSEISRQFHDEVAGAAPVLVSVFLSLACAIALAPEGELLCGQGADELFLGYAHFRGLTADAAAGRADDDLSRLVRDDWPRTGRIAARLGRTISAPYLEAEFVAAARSIPVVARLPSVATKPLWRAWCRHRDLPAEIADRPKRALQYGSGVARRLRHRGR